MKIRTVMPALALTSALVLAGCGDDGSMEGMDMGAGTTPSATSGPSESTTSSAQDGDHNDADVMFLQMMYPHHAQATEMAQMVQGRTDNQAVLDLAAQIEQAQGPEMEQMATLLESYGEPAPSADMSAMEGMDHGSESMEGMMTEQDMASLEAASGREFDQMWLSMMIEHHTGAVEMARTELEDGSDPQAQQLATDIIAAQEAEITTMEELINQP
ncbi:DUF305 domain-containing protein [uncultured Pseudokineococcus sp.]|uniref:DUF305 domain-containing protein n=1 Tax=uncultured Pseudokineococcus sp. TaxID=1642928 RepID=UPI002639C043|nr:DUF305 domain-containing protein [uncultured Pseudokineococcus sp.]